MLGAGLSASVLCIAAKASSESIGKVAVAATFIHGRCGFMVDPWRLMVSSNVFGLAVTSIYAISSFRITRLGNEWYQ